MKTHIVVFFLLIFVSCGDLLDENPKSLASENFYNTKEEVEGGLNAIYAPFATPMKDLYPAQQEAYADYGFGRGSYTLVSKFQGLDDANIVRVDGMWGNFYRAIRNANIILDRVPLSESLNDSEKTLALSEAKFLRGLVYLILVQNWGGVPLRTADNMGVVDIPRAPVSEVWALIEEDLRSASEHLPDQPRKKGTPSKWSAKTVLVECLLHLERYQEAKQIAEDIMASNQYKLVEINNSEDFLKIFGTDATSSTEEILYVKYAREGGKGWQFPLFPHHPAAGYLGGAGYFALHSDSENKVIKNWDENDLRKEFNWYEWDIGLGPTTLLNRKYRDESAPSSNSIGIDYPLYRYADLLLWYAELDCRVSGVATESGLEALNQVRRRGYGYQVNQPSPIDFKLENYTDMETFLNVVVKERGYETCYEGKRWLDLKRLGIAKVTMKDVYNIDVSERHMLWPIPLSEMNYNKALVPERDQNPGY
ncbi:RagB/SusD family nutrient uptake outer membrane protein [Parapedobacter tibetensis]|uniref:RagB/SusD family nutrient uptake outer membrane protein n=1 Tax=Parapedobacter tibetensis TaxID=2972951 RepID=UPI00214DCA6C|nr:RagB/SusD family nutrient uptake outer membrane protein [Parapedobacter tibetensis]